MQAPAIPGTNGHATNRTAAPAARQPVGYPLAATLLEAVKDDLRQLLDQPDFDHRTLGAIEKTAKAMRELIIGRTNVRLNATRRGPHFPYGAEAGGIETIADPIEEAGPTYSQGMSPMVMGAVGAGPMGAENFGANLHRELAGALQRRNPVDVVRAIAEAKALGLHDVAARLQEELVPRAAPLDTSSLGAEPAGASPASPAPVAVAGDASA